MGCLWFSHMKTLRETSSAVPSEDVWSSYYKHWAFRFIVGVEKRVNIQSRVGGNLNATGAQVRLQGTMKNMKVKVEWIQTLILVWDMEENDSWVGGYHM